MDEPRLEAVYFTAALGIKFKNFDADNPVHIKIKTMLEEKSFYLGVRTNFWMRKDFHDWNNFQFWTKEVQKLVARYPDVPPPPDKPTPNDGPVNLERIGEKIRRLLALSQSPNEAEAMLAFAKAQEMLTRHNLSMADLADETPESVEEIIIEETGQSCTWKEFLFRSVAKANYCYGFYKRNRQGVKSIMLGRPSNAKSAEIQFNYLVEAVDRLANLTGGDRTFKNSFRLGAAERLENRILEGMKKLHSEGIVGNGDLQPVSAIVVRSLYEKLDAEVQVYVAKNLKIKTKKSRISSISAEGYFAGCEAGDRVSLNKQVGGSNQRYLP